MAGHANVRAAVIAVLKSRHMLDFCELATAVRESIGGKWPPGWGGVQGRDRFNELLVEMARDGVLVESMGALALRSGEGL